MKKLFVLLSEKILPLGILFLLIFIPIYPKLPVVDIFGTWVYIRLEDFLVLTLAVLFLFTRWYERKFSTSHLTSPIVIYWAIGLLSLVNSIFIIGPHLMNYFPHLAILHFLRRIEYMILFFIAYEVVSRNRNFLGKIIWSLAFVMICITVYGIGQKFAGFPAFLTMNEEFAKGVPLRLPPTARIVSTFGGHYDLAAYLVLLIPVFGSLVIGTHKLWQKLLFMCITIGSVVLLLFTASRVSFGVYLVAISTMLVWQKKKLLIIPVIVASIILLNFVSSASERFYKTFRYQDVIVDLSTGKPIGTLDKLEGSSAVVEKIESPAEENLPKGSGFIGISGDSDKQQINRIIVSKDIATGSGEVATLSGSFLIQKALVYDISITTRFQGQWPKAIDAFKRNMLLGSGFSTLSTAVDGNYHRLLGETGLLGAFAFLGIIAYSIFLFIRGRKDLNQVENAFITGLFAGLIGLLLNAVLIDVFEASKVAFSFWMLMGVSMALLPKKAWTHGYLPFLRKMLLSNVAVYIYVFWGAVYLYRSALQGYFLGDDFTWLRWAAESSWADMSKTFIDSSGFFYRPVPKIWYFVLYSIFWLKQSAYHIISVLLYASISLLMYFVMQNLRMPRFVSILSALFFAGLAIHHENVFWISGQSSLLGAFFIILAINFSILEKQQKQWKGHLYAIAVWVSTFLSMLSYDSLVIAPLIIFFQQIFINAMKIRNAIIILILIPTYWVLRNYADAIMPSGDYGYRTSTFLVNSLANTFTYFFAAFIGPKVIEQVTFWRSMLRAYIQSLTLAFGIVGLLFVTVIWKTRKNIWNYTRTLVWFLCFLISLLPFMGLGGTAERYTLVPSIFLIFFLASVISETFKRTRSKMTWGILALPFVVVFIWNIFEVSRISKDWSFASHVSEDSLLKLKREYFPFGDRKTFVFVDTPIRYGRAWIFPVGLTDALWHMFRQSPHKVIQMSDLEEALSYPTINGTTVVHRFEDYTIKKVEVQFGE